MSHSPNRAIRWLIVSLLGLLGAQGLSLAAAEPPTEPLLRLETGMHTAPIRRIDVDAQERYLVSGSDDKTVRVWNLMTGQLQRVLRPPIGPDNEGKIYAVAISPDGATIVASGRTSASDASESIYVFDRDTGHLRQRISGLPSDALHLAFRLPDGEAFVATLKGHGIRIYRTKDGAELAKDEDYGDSSHGAAFDRQGRLVTSCFDGYMRLYSPEFRKVGKKRAPASTQSGVQPYAVSFSPDGQFVAVGFVGTTAVNVLSGQDLSFVFSPDTRGMVNGSVSSVTWSTDGGVLYAGGKLVNSAPILRWGEGGRGTREELRTAAFQTIMGLKPLQAGGVVYGTQDPAIGRVDAAGRVQLLQGPRQANYATLLEHFLVSADGSLVQFGYQQTGQALAQFSVLARLLTLAPLPAPSLTAPRINAPGLTVNHWNNTLEPTLNGRPLNLKPSEVSLSLAINAEGSSILLGTQSYLRLFDRTGAQQWEKTTPSIAWSVNIPLTDKVAVAAFGDGTIRWYRVKDGEELLALFPHPDGQHWILWTPQGYFDAAAGAEDLLGWHINRDPDQEALFYPVARFREQFYRPDVISLVLDTLDVQDALHRANDAQKAAVRLSPGGPVTATGQPRDLQRVPNLLTTLPPVVEFIGIADGTTVDTPDLVVSYLLKSPTGEAVSEINALIDGKVKITLQDPLSSGEKEVIQKLTLPFPKRDATVSLVAKNNHGLSEPATARLHWRGRQESRSQANLYVLAIGVGTYPKDSKIQSLHWPGKDARDIAALLKRQAAGLYQTVITHVLDDEKAIQTAIADELFWLEKETGPDDVALMFLAGHGVKDEQGEYYFLSYNAKLDRLKPTAVRGLILRDTLMAIGRKGKVLFLLDTCYSGSLLDFKGARGESGSQANVDELANALIKEPNGPIVFSSSTGKQLSQERDEWKNGAFTKALLEGLMGQADKHPSDKAIDVNELERYLYRRVKELTKGEQTPTTAKPQGFTAVPIMLVR